MHEAGANPTAPEDRPDEPGGSVVIGPKKRDAGPVGVAPDATQKSDAGTPTTPLRAAMRVHAERVARLHRLAEWHDRHAAHLEDRAETDERSGMGGDAIQAARTEAGRHRADAAELRQVAEVVAFLSPLRLRLVATALRQVRAAGLEGAAADLGRLTRAAWRFAEVATPRLRWRPTGLRLELARGGQTARPTPDLGAGAPDAA